MEIECLKLLSITSFLISLESENDYVVFFALDNTKNHGPLKKVTDNSSQLKSQTRNAHQTQSKLQTMKRKPKTGPTYFGLKTC